MKNARIKSITHRLFALVMALLLAVGGFMMDVKPVHAETYTVPASGTPTSYDATQLEIRFYANAGAVSDQNSALGPFFQWMFLSEGHLISGGNKNYYPLSYTHGGKSYTRNIYEGQKDSWTVPLFSSYQWIRVKEGSTWKYYHVKDAVAEVTCKKFVSETFKIIMDVFEKEDDEPYEVEGYTQRYTAKFEFTLYFQDESGNKVTIIPTRTFEGMIIPIGHNSHSPGCFCEESNEWWSQSFSSKNPIDYRRTASPTPELKFYSPSTFQGITNYKPPYSNYANPIVTKNPLLIQTVGEAPAWTRGIEATWGKTTSKIITENTPASNASGGSGGTITDKSLSGGTDAFFSSNGQTLEKIGVKSHNYEIKDAHSIFNSGDNTSATTSRNIIVKTDASPALEAYYEGTNVVYGGEWLSQYAPVNSEEAPDEDHYKSVDLKASGTGIAGTYDTVIWKGATGSGTEVKRGTNTNTATYTFGAPGVETSADGQKFYANLQEVNNGTVAKNAGLEALSGDSDPVTVFIDSKPPTTSIAVNTDGNGLYAGLTNSSSDTLSGIDETYVAFVEAGGDAPTITNGTWTEVDAVAEGTTYQAGKTYDIYAYSMDKATNKSAVMKLLGNPVTTPSIDVSVEKHLKDTNITKVQKGDELEYVIKVKNAGTAHATSYQIVDTLPAGLEYVSDDGGGTVNGQDVTWTKTIAAGVEMTITLKARVNDTVSAGAELKNRVVVKDENGDPVGGAEDESEEVEVKKPQAEVTKTADKDRVKLGDKITYTIKVKNTGEVPVKDWTVTDTLGDGLTYVSDDASGTNSEQVTTWTVNLAVGETKEIKLVAKVTDKDGAIKNGVEVRGSEPDDPATDEDESIEDEDDSESTLQFDVTFVDEDGETVLKEKTVYDYKTKAADIAKPADPKKAPTDKYVYVFKGWEPEVSDVTEDVVYKATYEEKKKYYLPKDKDDDEPVNPEDPFDEDGEEPEIGDTFIGEDGEEYKIIEIGELNPDTGEIPIKVGKLFTLTFNLEGGELNGQTDVIKVKELKNETIIILGEPTREGYKFEYWQGSKYYPGDEYKVTEHHTFTAIWTKLPDETPSSTKTPDSKDKSSDSKSVNTGDENNLLLWSVLLWASAVGVVVARGKKRKV